MSDMYGDWQGAKEELQSEFKQSLGPRSSSSLFDTVAALGLTSASIVLDIGARDARYSVTLHELLSCKVVAVEPVPQNVEEARRLVGEAALNDWIEVRQGTIQQIPADDRTFDLVFCRDVLSHVADLRAALQDSYRVTAENGRMVVYQTFGTDRLEPAETARICGDLAVEPSSLDRDNFEREVENSGFEIEAVDIVGSEWREAWEEDGTHRTSIQLLHAARLIRAEPQMRLNMGDTPYRVELSNALWGIYQMIGKLEPRVYTLRRASDAKTT